MRRNGILMHISSLPSDYGIGTMGKAAYDFADYLEKAGQSVWQILPVNPTGFGDSPYASYSTYAGNPYFIDLDMLAEDGLLKKEEYAYRYWGDNPEHVEYEHLYNSRFPVLELAAKRFLENPPKDYAQFKKDNEEWLEDFALFEALKKKHQGKPWTDWEKPYCKYDSRLAKVWARELRKEMEPYKVWQYLFFKQWNSLKDYVNAKGIKIIGDMPIYCAMDSVDAWSHPEAFLIDEKGKPEFVAGYPPESKKDTGQLWGNPLYNWKQQKKDNYEWWVNRVRHLTNLYDILRIDHFIGFDSYYAIPAKTMDPADGKWEKGPGYDLFRVLKRELGNPEIIVEDLGRITPSVKQLLRDVGYPGMKILEFAFYDRNYETNPYLPYNINKDSVAYLGTHDNNTIQGWLDSLNYNDLQYVKEFVHSHSDNKEVIHWDLVRTLLGTPAETTILQAQDLKALGGWSQMNQPNTVGMNWTWRIKKGALDDENAAWVKNITSTYGRLPVKPKKEKKEEAEDKKVPAKTYSIDLGKEKETEKKKPDLKLK
ncbi:MAG: 4-alpha-glucanotransferase [Erysipelotrichaceae bacterium]|nr:4-alpha-glucanotransferase [Erysipelotrichaceae bacterium]